MHYHATRDKTISHNLLLPTVLFVNFLGFTFSQVEFEAKTARNCPPKLGIHFATLRKAVLKSLQSYARAKFSLFEITIMASAQFLVSITPPYAKKFVNLFISFPVVHTVCENSA